MAWLLLCELVDQRRAPGDRTTLRHASSCALPSASTVPPVAPALRRARPWSTKERRHAECRRLAARRLIGSTPYAGWRHPASAFHHRTERDMAINAPPGKD